MDWLTLDIDLPGQEERVKRFSHKLTDTIRTLDERLQELEYLTSGQTGEVQSGDYGGLDTEIGYTAGLGVQVKVKRSTLLYEVRWRRTDTPDTWHYMLQGVNEFTIPVEEPENLEVQIRYLPDAFSRWTPWKTLEITPEVQPAEGVGGTGDVTVTVEGNTAYVSVVLPKDVAVPKSIGNFGLFIKLARYTGGTEPTEADALFWGTVPYPQNTFTLTNLAHNATYYLFIRLATFGLFGGDWVAIQTVKRYETVTFTTEYGDFRLNIDPPFTDTYITLHSMESTSGWSVSSGASIDWSTNRVEGNFSLRFKRSDASAVMTATYTFTNTQSNSGYPVFSFWYYVPSTQEQLNYLKFYFKDAGGSTLFTASFDRPTGVGSWRNYTQVVSESSSIKTIVIEFTWKTTRTGWVHLDFLGFYQRTYLPSLWAEGQGGKVLFYPPTGLPGFLSICQPVETDAESWDTSTTLTVPAGKIYYVHTALLSSTASTLRLGGANVYQSFTGANNYEIYQVVGSGESIQFQRDTGTCRILFTVFNLPPSFQWYTDQAMTTTTPFPPEDNYVGWIWDWSMTGGATAFQPTDILVNIATPTECKRNVFKPWIHWGGRRFFANTGTIYVSGLFAIKEVA